MHTADGSGRHAHSAGRNRAVLLIPLLLVLVAAVVLIVHPWSSVAKPTAAAAPAITAAASRSSGSTSATATHTAAQPLITGSLQAPAKVSQPQLATPGIPVQVTVARLGISSSLQALGIEPDGTLQSPSQYPVAGWYAKGIRPGAVGPALIAGHVDSYQGPAVFYRLREMKIGDDVTVRDDKGVVRHFTVSSVQEYPKNKFPTEAVYGPTALPVLRLVTCTGDFDVSKRSYVDNLVVTADLRQPRAG